MIIEWKKFKTAFMPGKAWDLLDIILQMGQLVKGWVKVSPVVKLACYAYIYSLAEFSTE